MSRKTRSYWVLKETDRPGETRCQKSWEEWVLPAASINEPEEGEFVAESGAGMHMVSKKDRNFAELETMRISRNPTTVITANGEVQTREEATVYVEELDLFVKAMLLEETPAVLSLGKLCEDHGYTYHWTSGQKPHLTKNGKRSDCNISNYVPFVVLGLSTSSSTTSTPTSPTSSSQDSVISTENLATERRGSVSAESRWNPLHKQIKETRKYRAIYCMTCRTGYRNSEKNWLMKEVF